MERPDEMYMHVRRPTLTRMRAKNTDRRLRP